MCVATNGCAEEHPLAPRDGLNGAYPARRWPAVSNGGNAVYVPTFLQPTTHSPPTWSQAWYARRCAGSLPSRRTPTVSWLAMPRHRSIHCAAMACCKQTAVKGTASATLRTTHDTFQAKAGTGAWCSRAVEMRWRHRRRRTNTTRKRASARNAAASTARALVVAGNLKKDAKLGRRMAKSFRGSRRILLIWSKQFNDSHDSHDSPESPHAAPSRQANGEMLPSEECE